MGTLSRNKQKPVRKSYVTILKKKNTPQIALEIHDNKGISLTEKVHEAATLIEPIGVLTEEQLEQQMLTHRQQETLRLLAQGMSNKQIAQQLNISVKTVDAHRASIMTRLRIHNLAGLVKYAIRTGLTTLE